MAGAELWRLHVIRRSTSAAKLGLVAPYYTPEKLESASLVPDHSLVQLSLYGVLGDGRTRSEIWLQI